ncbi:MAG: hypothetical protein H7301_00825 [Cryobacterium sp.]|nr:hypothetical protein [Oligoflexia bacterium]
MKTTKALLMSLTIATLSFAAFGCNDNEDVARSESFKQQEIQHGTYVSTRCFKNGATLTGVLTDVYSTGDVTLNADGTASVRYRNFSDNTCTTEKDASDYSFTETSVQLIGGVSVLKLKHDAVISWYIPFALSDEGYSFDVDATDGHSGPYLVQPTENDVKDFGLNAGQGVSFKHQ